MEEGGSWLALWKPCCFTSVISIGGSISQDSELTNNRTGNVLSLWGGIQTSVCDEDLSGW